MCNEKDIFNKIIGYATDMISGKIEYKKYYDEYQKLELQQRTLKIALNNPNNFKEKRIQQTSYIAINKTSGYYKTDYAYPELETKKSELKALEKEIEINRTKASLLHNKFTINQHLLYVFVNNLEIEDLKKIIEYLDIDVGSNFFNITSSDMANIIYKQITFDIGILLECDIKTNIKDIYKGSATLLNILIDYKNSCVDSINSYNELNENYENKKKELTEKEAALIKQRKHYYKIYFLFPTKKTKSIINKIDNKIGNLYWDDSYYLDKLYIERIKKGELYKKYFNLYSYLNVIIDSTGEKTLRQLITNLNIVIPRSDANYFNEKEEMRTALKNWFEETLKQMIIENKLENSEFKEYIQINGNLSTNKKIFESQKQLIKK